MPANRMKRMISNVIAIEVFNRRHLTDSSDSTYRSLAVGCPIEDKVIEFGPLSAIVWCAPECWPVSDVPISAASIHRCINETPNTIDSIKYRLKHNTVWKVCEIIPTPVYLFSFFSIQSWKKNRSWNSLHFQDISSLMLTCRLQKRISETESNNRIESNDSTLGPNLKDYCKYYVRLNDSRMLDWIFRNSSWKEEQKCESSH